MEPDAASPGINGMVKDDKDQENATTLPKGTKPPRWERETEWRQKPSTQAQRDYLEDLVSHLTRGEMSDLIDHVKAVVKRTAPVRR